MEFFSSFFLAFLGPTEIILGVLVIVLLFGGKKIPELMKGLGKGMGEFKKARQESERESQNNGDLTTDEKSKLEK